MRSSYTHVQNGTSIFQDVNLDLVQTIWVWGRKSSISKIANSGSKFDKGLSSNLLKKKESALSCTIHKGLDIRLPRSYYCVSILNCLDRET
mmetsp:Transcript_12505/g.23433  ORF Transcript_12505/g.23433 Transcript_12505/m.23433 type:complete len:91 (+) Transcript_12505:187-459(+)